MHDAGLLAFNFGPALLTSWKSAVYMEFSSPNGGTIEPTVLPQSDPTKPLTFDRYEISESDKGIDAVKIWITEHLRDRLNLSPDTPANGAFTCRGKYILLFSSPKPPDCNWDDDDEPILFRRNGTYKNEALNKCLLLGIPCTAQVFGWSVEKERSDLDSLKSLMHHTGKVSSSK